MKDEREKRTGVTHDFIIKLKHGCDMKKEHSSVHSFFLHSFFVHLSPFTTLHFFHLGYFLCVLLAQLISMKWNVSEN